jgi:hypothetical protein
LPLVSQNVSEWSRDIDVCGLIEAASLQL